MRPKVPASRKPESRDADNPDDSDHSIKAGDITTSKRLSQIMQLLLKVRKKHQEAVEEPIERNKFVIAPDGYVPNSTVRSFVTPHKYPRFIEKTLPTGKVEIGPDLLDTIYYCLLRYNTLKENPKVQATGRTVAHTEAKIFQQFVNLEESKRVTNLIKQIKLSTTDRILDAYDMKHKVLSKQMTLMQLKSETLRKRRAELTAFARQQISIQKAKMRAEMKSRENARRASRIPAITVNAADIALTAEDMAIMEQKLITKFGNRSSMFQEVEKFLNADTAAMEAMAKALGSDERAQQFVGAIKRPNYLLEFLQHKFGGLDRVFSLIDSATLGDFDAIHTMSRAVGEDTDAIVRFVAFMEKTTFAAANCLQTKARNFPYVEDYISLLLKRDWSESELKDLANGRYKEESQPGDLSITNPLTTIATRMSEEMLFKFYKALKTADYEFFTKIGNVKFEQDIPRDSHRRKTSNDDGTTYAGVLADMEKPENRFILRPQNELLKQLAGATTSIPLIASNEDHLPTEVSRYFAQLVSRAQLVMAASIIMEATTEISPLEEISELIYNVLTMLNNAVYHLKKAGGGSIDEQTAYTIALEVMRGNINEAYRVKMLMGSKLGGHLVHCIQVAHGRLLDRILRYVLLTDRKDDLDHLLGEYLDAYNQQPMQQGLIHRWLTFAALAFKLAHEVGIAPSIPALIRSFQSSKFFREAGIPYAAKRMRVKADAPIGSHRLRSEYRPKMFITRKLSKRRTKKRPGQMVRVEELEVKRLSITEDEKKELAEEKAVAKIPPITRTKVDLNEEDIYHLELPKTQTLYKISDMKEIELTASTPLSRYKKGKKISEGVSFDETMKEAWESLAQLQNVDVTALKDWGEEEILQFKEKLFTLLWKFVNAISGVPRMRKQSERMQKGLAALGPWVKKKTVSPKTRMILWKTIANLKTFGASADVETTYYRLKKVLDDLKEDISDDDLDVAVRQALIGRRLSRISVASSEEGLGEDEEKEEEDEEEEDVDEDGTQQETDGVKYDKVKGAEAKTRRREKKDGSPRGSVLKRLAPMRSDSLRIADIRMQQILSDISIRSHSSRIATTEDEEELSEGTGQLSSKKSLRKGTEEEETEEDDEDLLKGMMETDFDTTKRPLDIQLDLDAAKQRLGAESKDTAKSRRSAAKGKKTATGSTSPASATGGSGRKSLTVEEGEAAAAAAAAAAAIVSDPAFGNQLENLLADLLNMDGSPVDDATKGRILAELVVLLQSKGLTLEEALRLAKAMIEAKLLGKPFDLSAELTKALTRIYRTKIAASLASARSRKGRLGGQRALSILDWREILRTTTQTYDQTEQSSSVSVASSSTSVFPRSLSTEVGKSPGSLSSHLSSGRPTFRANKEGEWEMAPGKRGLYLSRHKETIDVSSSETISTVGSGGSPITSSSLEMRLSPSSEDSDDNIDDYMRTEEEEPYVRDPTEPWFPDEDVVEHIVECLGATAKISQKALQTFKNALLSIADDTALPPKLSQIFKKANYFQSAFAHDSDMKTMRVFKDVVRMLSEAKLLNQENAGSYVRQIAGRTDWLLRKFAQIGFIYLNNEDEEALFKVHEALTNVPSSSLEGWTEEKDISADDGVRLPRMSTYQLVAILHAGESEKTNIRQRFLPPITKLPPSRVASTVIIAQNIFPLLAIEAIKDVPKHTDLPRSLQRIVAGLEGRIEKMVYKVGLVTRGVAANDIDALATKAREQRAEIRRRVSQRVSLLGVGGLIEDYQDEEEKPTETRKRLILRPSWIKPGEWHQLVGKTRVSVLRFDDTALCHRAEYPVSSMVKADQQPGLSHRLVANYDLLHACNRHSLAQLAHICSIKKNER